MSRQTNYPQENFVYNNLSNSPEASNLSSPSNVSNTTQIVGCQLQSSQLHKENHKIISKSNICIIFALISILFLLFLLCNFFLTINAFNENKVVTLKPEIICKQFITEHNACLNRYRKETEPQQTIDECLSQSLNLQYCYDKVYFYNKKCYIYFSEFEKCVRDYKKIDDSQDFIRRQCKRITQDIQRCTSEYMTIDPFVLLINHS
jgi:hypothetical protein